MKVLRFEEVKKEEVDKKIAEVRQKYSIYSPEVKVCGDRKEQEEKVGSVMLTYYFTIPPGEDIPTDLPGNGTPKFSTQNRQLDP